LSFRSEDEVLLPAGMTGDWVGTVSALSSDYRGPCKRIVRIVCTRREAEERDAATAAVPVAGLRAGATMTITARCGHRVLLHIEEVNRVGRPTHVTYRCEACDGISHSAALGSAEAWRMLAAGFI
jgi:hypothetical protein